MAREVVTKCDKCGKPGEDVEVYRLSLPDGTTFDVDLDAEHAKPLTDLAQLGRLAGGGARRPEGSNAHLEGRIRGLS